MFSRYPPLGPNTLGWLSASVLIILTMAACTAQPVVPAPTQPPPGPTVDLAATQAALNVASTQVAGAQATLTAESQAQAAAAAGTAQAAEVAAGATTQASTAQAAAASQAAQVQAVSATQTALVEVANAQAVTATALARVAAALATPTAPAAPVSPSRTPTRTPFPRSNAACVALDSGLAPIANAAAAQGLDLGCPTAPTSPVQGAVQEYWTNIKDPNPRAHLRSLMIWRGDTREIYVIHGADASAGKGALMVYADTYQDGNPDLQPACANMQAPGGYQMPVRGFGKVWCDNNLGVVVGWPNRNEVQARLLVQPTRNGVLLQVSAPDAGLGYLAALDYGSGRAVTSMIQP